MAISATENVRQQRTRGVLCTPVFREGRVVARCVRLCETYDAQAACDLLAEPYRIDDRTPPRERCEILSVVARAAVDMQVGGVALWPGQQQRACIHPAIAEATRMALGADRRYTLGQSSVDATRAADILLWIQQNVPYRADKEGEWYAGPVWTLQHGGDCTTLAPVLVAMLAAAGVPSQLVWINQPGFSMNHFASRVLVNGKLYWADPSLKGARFGERPDVAAHRLSMGSVIGAS
jgi:hypothetical protein